MDEHQETLEAFAKQADIAHQRQAWDDLIKICQLVLKQYPNDIRFRLELAHSYDAKGQRDNFKPAYLMALQEYWRLLALDPNDQRIHDGLLACAMKADQMEEVLEEFRTRMNQFPDIKAYRVSFGKIQTLLLLKAEPVKATDTNQGQLIQTIVGRIFPIVGFVGLLTWMFLSLKKDAGPVTHFLRVSSIRTSMFLFVSYFVFLGIRFLRSSR